KRPKRIKDNKYIDSLGGSRHHLIKGAKNKDAIYDLARHLNSLPVQQQMWRTSPGYAVPAYKNFWDDPLVTNEPNAVRAKAIAYPEERFTGLRDPGPPSAAVDAIGGGTYYTDMMAEVLQGKSPEDAAKDYHNRFVQIFKDFGLKGS